MMCIGERSQKKPDSFIPYAQKQKQNEPREMNEANEL